MIRLAYKNQDKKNQNKILFPKTSIKANFLPSSLYQARTKLILPYYVGKFTVKLQRNQEAFISSSNKINEK